MLMNVPNGLQLMLHVACSMCVVFRCHRLVLHRIPINMGFDAFIVRLARSADALGKTCLGWCSRWERIHYLLQII
jgi:hypothetical protein